jgi:hypothetical protein
MIGTIKVLSKSMTGSCSWDFDKNEQWWDTKLPPATLRFRAMCSQPEKKEISRNY